MELRERLLEIWEEEGWLLWSAMWRSFFGFCTFIFSSLDTLNSIPDLLSNLLFRISLLNIDSLLSFLFASDFGIILLIVCG